MKNNSAGDTILSGLAILGISVSIVAILAKAPSEVLFTTCALFCIGVAGAAWLLDKQAMGVAKNPAGHFAKDNLQTTKQIEQQSKAPSLGL